MAKKKSSKHLMDTLARIGRGPVVAPQPPATEPPQATDINVKAQVRMLRIAVGMEQWQGSIIRIRQGRTAGLRIAMNGYSGTAFLGDSSCSFIYQPNERIVRIDAVRNPQLEHAMRQWLGEIPLEATA